MTTRQLHQAVSRATGEDADVIAQRGFTLVEEETPLADDDWESLALDWDEIEALRSGEPLAAA